MTGRSPTLPAGAARRPALRPRATDGSCRGEPLWPTITVMRVGLVGCTKSKQTHAAPARDLYTPSALFRGRRDYVERSCGRWFVLSAKYGLVDPDSIIEPYDQTLTKASE